MPHPRQEEPKICRRCGKTKPAANFGSEPRNRDGLKSYCRPCDSKVANAWRKKDPKRHAKYNRAWAKKNQRSIRNTRMKRLYGITMEHYEAMLASQGGGCAICGAVTPGGTGIFHVDHCHDSNAIRGLLCGTCNMGIGQLNHDPLRLQAAIDYLAKYSASN